MKKCILITNANSNCEDLSQLIYEDEKWELVKIVGIDPSKPCTDLKWIVENYQPDVCFIQQEAALAYAKIPTAQSFLNEVLSQHQLCLVCFSENDKFAYEALSLGVIDCLIHPFSLARLDKVYQKCHSFLFASKASDKPCGLIAVKSIGFIEFINVNDILWVKGAANYAELHCKDRVILHRETLLSLEEKLANSGFVRVHRSALINYTKIKTISSELGRFSILQMLNGEEVKLSTSYKDQLFLKLGVA